MFNKECIKILDDLEFKVLEECVAFKSFNGLRISVMSSDDLADEHGNKLENYNRKYCFNIHCCTDDPLAHRKGYLITFGDDIGFAVDLVNRLLDGSIFMFFANDHIENTVN